MSLPPGFEALLRGYSALGWVHLYWSNVGRTLELGKMYKLISLLGSRHSHINCASNRTRSWCHSSNRTTSPIVPPCALCVPLCAIRVPLCTLHVPLCAIHFVFVGGGLCRQERVYSLLDETTAPADPVEKFSVRAGEAYNVTAGDNLWPGMVRQCVSLSSSFSPYYVYLVLRTWCLLRRLIHSFPILFLLFSLYFFWFCQFFFFLFWMFMC